MLWKRQSVDDERDDQTKAEQSYSNPELFLVAPAEEQDTNLTRHHHCLNPDQSW
jgi:hypothetical protein